ncbi:hypothetical protein ACHAXA_003995 [Cyclostephanos tholiformis]|uniref:Uncharacterized protein n=1 Tax=Cyclostephanos tholiformis TaxID=382380 RepID=A0ABD3RGA4_9STRA
MPPLSAATLAVSLNEELTRTISDATNISSGRRVCTRILSQWKKEILPNLSREEGLELLINADDRHDACEATAIPSIARTFLAIIDNDTGFLSEGHREASVDILKELFFRAFGEDSKGNDSSRDGIQAEDGLIATLIDLFLKLSLIFQKRMSRCDVSSKVNIHQGTMMEPMEPSEHIRHLFVELLVDLGGYCLNSNGKRFCIRDNKANSKVMIEATSNVCQTLAKSTFLDQCPEVQNAACTLVGLLSQLCPTAVRMNATSLLTPLTGRTDDTVGDVAQSSIFFLSKKCLFRHRHSKTRCRAVIASGAIVMCCPRQDVMKRNEEKSSDSMQSAAVDHLSSYGSHSTTMEQLLHDTLIPGWGDLLKLDSSATVQSTVMKSLSNIANILDWRYSPKSADTSQPQVTPATSLAMNCYHIDRRCHTPSNSPNMDLASMVEAHVLTLFLMGMSAGSAAQVRSLAVQALNNLHGETNEHIFPLERLGSYFQPMLGLILRSCSQDWASCKSKIRSLEALQVLLTIAIPLMNGKSEPLLTGAVELEMSDITLRSVMDVVSTNILSEEKDVLKSAQVLCRIIGANNHLSNTVVALLTGDENNIFAKDCKDVEEVHLHSKTSKMVDEKSPRSMTSILLTLDGMMKGSLDLEETASILLEINPALAIPTPDWFSPSIASAVSTFLCHPTIIRSTTANSLLAWSLSDACDSFAKSAQRLDEKSELAEHEIVCVSVSIAYLLSCPEIFGLTSCVMNTIDSFSAMGCCATSASKCEFENSCVLDVYFREIFAKIMSIASALPWKKSDPDFLATDALLRTCSGSTVGRNFDLVAPFFISHLSTSTGQKSNAIQILEQEKFSLTQDELADDYSLRITLMALMQTILSDESFCQNLGYPGELSSFSAEFTVDVLMTLVLPNLAWRSGSMASSLRKITAATLFSLLVCKAALVRPDTVAYLIPVLNSNLGDTEATIRELSCACLSLVLQQVSTDNFSIIRNSNNQTIDSLCPRLLELLDDDHGPVRLAGCRALKDYIFLIHRSASNSSINLGITLEKITSTLLIQLDDPDQDMKDHVFQVLVDLIELQCQDYATTGSSEMRGILNTMERQIHASLRSHQDDSYCQILMEKLGSFH